MVARQKVEHPLLTIDLHIDDKGWTTIRGLKPRLHKAAQALFNHLPKRFQSPATATVLLTSDKTVRRLNFDFRGLDKPTNVLSFPQQNTLNKSIKAQRGEPLFLGDIALGYQYMVAEAKKDRKMLLDHTTHLMIHGILHLFAYTHEADSDAAKMERLEKKIMHEMGLPDPYEPEPVKTVRLNQPQRKKSDILKKKRRHSII